MDARGQVVVASSDVARSSAEGLSRVKWRETGPSRNQEQWIAHHKKLLVPESQAEALAAPLAALWLLSYNRCKAVGRKAS